MPSSTPKVVEQGIVTLSDKLWQLAKHRMDVIKPLAEGAITGVQAIDAAAKELGVSRRTVYDLIKVLRTGDGLLTDLVPSQSGGGKDKGRLPDGIESVIAHVIKKKFLHKQKLNYAAVYREVVLLCKQNQLSVPAINTVKKRISQLDPRVVARKREGEDAARPLQGVGGEPPEVGKPLEQVQIDHTIIDLIIVNEIDRQPIGRPYLTIVIDVCTRCILGVVITLEAPSSVSVGLSLAHTVTDKQPWLESLGVDVPWPMSGKPQSIYVDNASEFKSEALRRGCEQHGITINYRPLGQPHFGGIVERVIGTMMDMIHEVPGTTFSNSQEKGKYNPDKNSVFTLRELQRWMVLAIAQYHNSVHETLLEPPIAKWQKSIAGNNTTYIVGNAAAFLVDFLPVVRRKLHRTGFIIDHIWYYSNALKPWIAKRHELDNFVVRRDPRDISRIWVLEPSGEQYLEVPYRSLSLPAVTLWEHQQAISKLRKDGRAEVNEELIFRCIMEMRNIVNTAQSLTRKQRRDQERKRQIKFAEQSETHNKIPIGQDNSQDFVAKPFDQIEEW